MAITVGSVGANVASGSGAGIEVAAPAGISDGDLLVLCASASASTGDLTLSVDEAGWTIRKAHSTTGGIDRSMMVATKVAASEAGTYTVSTVVGGTATISARMFALSGVHADVVDQTPPAGVNATATNTADPPSITTQTADALVVTYVVANTTPALQPAVVPTGHTELWQSAGTPAHMASYKQVASPGAEDPSAWTGIDDNASAATCAITLAFKADAPAGHPALSRTRGIPGMNTIASPFGRGW